jgi:hypothetical protein
VYLRKYEKNKNAVGNSVYCFAHVMLTFAKGKCKLDLCGQGYCRDGTCWDAVLEVLYHKDTSWNGIPEPLSPGIDVTNTFPLLTEVCVTLFL